jgi:DNA-binding GntR family transcriptional regulator
VAESLSDIAYRHITKKLIASELVPGQKISEQTIASECAISRTPVREAIRQLTEEGILFQIPSSGTYVARPDRRQLIDAYEVRLALECFAIDQAVKNLTKETRQELRRLCDEMYAIIISLRTKQNPTLEGPHLVTFLSDDLSFHLLLMKAAGNRLAIKIVTNAYQRNHFFGHHSHRRDLHHLAWVWRHHAMIERAIRRGAPDAARRWMTAHIARSLRDALAAFDRAATHAAEDRRDPVNDALARLSDSFA